MLVVYLARLTGLDFYQQVLIGIAAIIGHNWPIFLRFSGGRGILTTAGVIFSLAPWLALTMTIVTLLFAPFRQLPLGALLVLAAAPLYSWFHAPAFRIEQPLPITLGCVMIFLLVVIRRLTVSRTKLSTLTPTRELVMNRLLFDRDIKDREAWTKRTPLKVNSTEKPLDLSAKKK